MSSNGPIDRIFGAILPRAVNAIDVDEVVNSVDVDALVERIDVNALVERIDLDQLLQNVDLNALLQRVDVETLLAKIDLNDLLKHVDVDALVGKVDVESLIERVDVAGIVNRVDIDQLLDRVDVNALVARIDVDQLLAHIDVDQLLARIDVDDLVRRAHIDAIVANASKGVTARLIDTIRRQLVGIDAVMIGGVNRVRHRSEHDETDGGVVTGKIAGGASRLAAYFVDAVVISVSYGFTTALVGYMVNLFSGKKIPTSFHGWLSLGLFGLFGFLYYWIGLSLTGRSIGKGLVGLRVVRSNGQPITPGRAAVRMLIYPLSFILGLGLLPIIFAKRRRALHDIAADDLVLYDWGDRPAELPAPIAAWVARRSV